MASAAVTIDSKSACGFCCLLTEYMVDPRVLPCGHVYCIGCLEKHAAGNNKSVECYTCGETHKDLDIGNLEKPIVLGMGAAASSSTQLTCDIGKCQGKMAVSFCIDCAKKLCDKHKQTHDSLYEDEHDVIHIYDYERSPAKYKKVYCIHHKKEIPIKACRLCYRMVCNECDRTEGDCAGYPNQHDYATLTAVAEEITAQTKKLLDSAIEKKADIHKADKKSRKDLEAVDKVCREWIKQVESVRDEQIKQLTEAYEPVLEKIREYQGEMTTQAVSFNSELINKKEQLEESRVKVHQLMRDGHVTEKISQHQQVTDGLKGHVKGKLGGCELNRSVALVFNRKSLYPNVDFIKLPSALTFSSEHSTDSQCSSACHREDGNILVGCVDGVKLLNKDSMELTKYDLPFKGADSVVEHRHAVYILHRSDNYYKVEMCLPDLQHSLTLLQFQSPRKYAGGMAVSDRYIVVFNPIEGQWSVLVYNRLTKQTTTTQFTTTHNPYFLPGGELLTAGDHQLIKYKIEDGEITPIWTCKGLKNVGAVCTDQQGIIYAATSNNQKSIYIFSPGGEKLHELTHEKLPAACTGQISIRGNQIAVPGWYDNKLYLFNIDH